MMTPKYKKALFIVVCICSAAASARAQTSAPAGRYSDNVIRIGVLTDMSGPASAASGSRAVIAAQMAADEVGNAINGVKVDIISANHQGKPDIGSGIARKWFDVGFYCSRDRLHPTSPARRARRTPSSGRWTPTASP